MSNECHAYESGNFKNVAAVKRENFVTDFPSTNMPTAQFLGTGLDLVRVSIAAVVDIDGGKGAKCPSGAIESVNSTREILPKNDHFPYCVIDWLSVI